MEFLSGPAYPLICMGVILAMITFITWRAAEKNGLLGWPIYPRNIQPPTEQVERLKQ